MSKEPGSPDNRLRRATIGDVLERRSLRDPHMPALVVNLEDCHRLELTYGQLDSSANQMARLMEGMGVGHGDVVATMARNGLDHVVSYYAALKLGAVFSTINPASTVTELDRQLESSSPSIIVAEASVTHKLLNTDVQVIVTESASDAAIPGSLLAEAIAPYSSIRVDRWVDETDLAMIIYTSGTESEPKGVRIPHRNFLLSTSPAWITERYVEPDDRFLLAAPMYTMAGVGTVTNLIAVGATIVMSVSLSPDVVLNIITRERITNMSQTPTFYHRLIDADEFSSSNLASLRQAHTYGGAIPETVVDAMGHRSPQLMWATYWGQTELSQLGSIGYYKDRSQIPGQDPRWVGRPVPQVEVQVVDENDAPTQVGELICRSPSVMDGYHKLPKLTESVLRGGWLRTGDIVRIDADQNLFFEDRKKDIIKSGGMNVSSLEVEGVLSRLRGIREAAVVGVPDPKWSEAVTAFLVADGHPPTIDEVLFEARAHLAPYKVPKQVHFVSALPRDAQGKVVKRALRGSQPE